MTTPAGVNHRLARVLERFDPGFVWAEYAARVTLTCVLSCLPLLALAHGRDLPEAGAWLGMTAAQYIAWFVVGDSRGQRLRLSIATTGFAAAGVAWGASLDSAAWTVAAVVGSTAAAFALWRVSEGLRTAALGCSYMMVLTRYYAPTPGDETWLIGATLGACVIALAVRFALWPEGRAPRRDALVRVYLRNLSVLAGRASRRRGSGRASRRRGSGRASRRRGCRAIARLQARAAPIEAALVAQGDTGTRIADRLAELRVRTTEAVLARPADAPTLAVPEHAATRDDPARVFPAATTGPTGGERLVPALQRAAQVAVALALAIPIGMWLAPERWAWSYLAALLMFYGTATSDDVTAKGWHRIGGTLLGAVAGIGLADVLGGHTWTAIAAILVLQFLAVYLQRFGYAASMLATTALLVLFFAVTGNAVPSIAELRFEETLAGAAAGLLAAAFVFPSRATTRSDAAFVDLASRLGAVLRAEVPVGPAARALCADLVSLRDTLTATRLASLARRGGRADAARLDRRVRLAAALVQDVERIELHDGATDERLLRRLARTLDTELATVRREAPPRGGRARADDDAVAALRALRNTIGSRLGACEDGPWQR